MSLRQIVLDTETTGMQVAAGNRIVEIGCVELLHRRLSGKDFHHYLNPDRDSEPGALEVHGLTREFLSGKPRFAEVMPALLDYVRGAEVLIHNAEFDVGFINAELARAGCKQTLGDVCTVVDTLQMARKKHPGQKNNLNALCERYRVDNSRRGLHGALKDATLLAQVYLAMTAGQSSLGLDALQATRVGGQLQQLMRKGEGRPLLRLKVSAEDSAAHRERMQAVAKAAEKEGRKAIWSE